MGNKATELWLNKLGLKGTEEWRSELKLLKQQKPSTRRIFICLLMLSKEVFSIYGASLTENIFHRWYAMHTMHSPTGPLCDRIRNTSLKLLLAWLLTWVGGSWPLASDSFLRARVWLARISEDIGPGYAMACSAPLRLSALPKQDVYRKIISKLYILIKKLL